MSENTTDNHMKGLLCTTLTVVFLAGCSGDDLSLSQPNTIIEGRVADGYLQGAVVCADLDENDSCDEGEPKSISVVGGQYTLMVPAMHVGAPILAEVPASAIDEDTGLAIGKKLRLSAPGDRPAFVSPLTTMVHYDRKSNPGRSTEEAAASVEESLGMDNEGEDTLFTDYVAGSDAGEEAEREKFRELHQNGRAIASLMGRVREKAEMQAIVDGIDLTGDPAARKAVSELVQQQARAQVENVSKAVKARVSEINNSTRGRPNRTEVINREFDPEATVEELNIEVLTELTEPTEAGPDE